MAVATFEQLRRKPPSFEDLRNPKPSKPSPTPNPEEEYKKGIDILDISAEEMLPIATVEEYYDDLTAERDSAIFDPDEAEVRPPEIKYEPPLHLEGVSELARYHTAVEKPREEAIISALMELDFKPEPIKVKMSQSITGRPTLGVSPRTEPKPKEKRAAILRETSLEALREAEIAAIRNPRKVPKKIIDDVIFEKRVKEQLLLLSTAEPEELNGYLASGKFLNVFNVISGTSRAGLQPGEKYKGETAVQLAAVDRIVQDMPLSMRKAMVGIAPDVARTILEFYLVGRIPVGKAKQFEKLPAAVQNALKGGAKFAGLEAMTWPRRGESFTEKAGAVLESGAIGTGVGYAPAIFPKAYMRVPAVTTGFMALTAAKGGSPEQIIETGVRVLGFEAVGLMQKAQQFGKERLRNIYADKAVKAARKQNPQLYKFTNEEVGRILENVARNFSEHSGVHLDRSARQEAERAYRLKMQGDRTAWDKLMKRHGFEQTKEAVSAVKKTGVANYEKASPDYVVNVDRAKYTLEGYDPADIANEKKYYGEAAEITGKVFDKWLNTRKGKGNNIVLFTAGGTGSGKSTIVDEAVAAETYPIVVDSTLSSKDYSIEQVGKAIGSGYEPEIVFVYREPADAWENGVWKRYEEGGHFVPAKNFLNTHIRARETLFAIIDKYGDKAGVQIFENRTGKNLKKITLDELKQKEYDVNRITEQINEISKQQIKDRPELKGSEAVFIPQAIREGSKTSYRKSSQVKPTEQPEKIEPATLRKPVTVSDKEYHPLVLPTESIGVDPKRFQFKLGAKLTGGVTEALKSVEKFDPIKGGTVLVWQDKEGKYWVIDGHHRVALARKTGQENMDTWVVREIDGWTDTDARAVGALRNLADGKGTAVDAAKLFRDSDISLKQLQKEGVPTNNQIVQQGMDMKVLSDEVFRMVIDEKIPANMAASIGKHVKGDTQQKQVADLIRDGEVETVRQAELLAMTIDNAPVLTKSEMTLFGLETTEKSLYAERAKVLANVEKKLKTNQKVFGTLSKQTVLIEAKGNVLAKEANIEAKERAEEVLYLLEKFANARGEVAEALNEATKEYANNPTRSNLSKVTNTLLDKWTETTTGLSVQNVEGLFGAPSKRPNVKESGFIDVSPVQKSFEAFLGLVEPSKLVEIEHGKDVYAAVIKGTHKSDVAFLEFNEKQIDNLDGNLREFGNLLAKYPRRILENLMLARGKPVGKEAITIQNDALQSLAKEAPELIGTRKMITRISDFNYDYLVDVVGKEIGYVEDYFYGIYKNPKKVERFIDYWRTTKKFTKEKKLPTVADAKAFGLELRDPNPVNNLRSEYTAIARLDGMIWMRDELLRTGKDEYISENPELLAHPERINQPVFKGLWVDATLAKMVKNLVATNKIQRYPALNALRHINNFLRSLKFTFSAFHHLAEAKQSIADSGYLGFYKKTATRGVTAGFKKGDPIFQTAEYKDYIAHGGGHRYSIDSEAQRAFSEAINRLNKSGKAVVRGISAPLKIPESYVKWLFQNYIPKVKYAKYLDSRVEQEKKLGRELTSAEIIDIIKEQQNFFGMMNERLFGRSSTMTTLLRFKFMAPGFAEGNFRSILKAMVQWGQGGTHRAGKSRANIINSFILTAIAASAGTMIMTGKPPKMPESAEDIRDLFKIDTGKVDEKGRKVMIDLMSYDKDYWTVFGKPLVGQAKDVPMDVLKRTGGMTATTWDIISDLNQMAMGKAIYDWKGDRIVEITDTFAQGLLSLIVYETSKITPISVNVYNQARERNLDRLSSALTMLLGLRPTTTEKEKREAKITSQIFSLRDQQERLYYYLGAIKTPRKHINNYNKIVQSILDNPVTTQEIKDKYTKNLIIDTDRLIANKVHQYELLKVSEKPKPNEEKKLKGWLDNFEIPERQYRKHLITYEMKHRKLITEMEVGEGDESFKKNIAAFYADKGILSRKVASGTATDKEKRMSRRYDILSHKISTIGTRIGKSYDMGERKRFYEQVKLIIKRAKD